MWKIFAFLRIYGGTHVFRGHGRYLDTEVVRGGFTSSETAGGPGFELFKEATLESGRGNMGEEELLSLWARLDQEGRDLISYVF